MSEVYVIIQARMTSTRLPGKVMLPLCGKTVLQVMLERISSWKNNVIVATTGDGSERPIVDLCNHLGVNYYRGSTNDVLGRYYNAAVAYGAKSGDVIVRLTSDCPLIDEALVTETINQFITGDWDAVSLGPHSGYPRGMDSSVFSFDILQLAHKKAKLAPDREHVTLGFNKFKTIKSLSLSLGEDLSHYRLTLDEPDDYTCIQAIYQCFGNEIDFSFSDLVDMLKNNPELAELNQHVQQKIV